MLIIVIILSNNIILNIISYKIKLINIFKTHLKNM